MKLLKVNDICELLNARPSTIYQWAELGQIPCFKINGLLRFEEKEILEWIKSYKKEPHPEYNNRSAGRRLGKEV